MVSMKYKNIELDSLFNRGNSSTFKAITNKKLFMQALYSFKNILIIINNVVELEYYHYLHYKRNSTFSTITVEGANLTGNIVFSEEDQGKSITIYDILIK